MRLFLVTALLIASAPAMAADLARIERKIVKEPVYESKRPGYCLLVFGQEAKTRVWVVRDGDTLYVDGNGNGDLTETADRFRRMSNHGGFKLDNVVASGWMTLYPYLRLSTHGSALERFDIDFLVPGKYKQSVQYTPFGDRPESAPIIHLDGPLTVGLLARKNGLHTPLNLDETPLYRSNQSRLIIFVGTPNFGKDAKPTCVMSCCDGDERCRIQQPDSFYPTAVIEYPGTTLIGGGLSVTIRLDDD